MSHPDLTKGAIAKMVQTLDPSTAILNPVCQVLSIKKIQAAANVPNTVGDRYRVILSDGEHFAQGKLTPSLHPLLPSSAADSLAFLLLLLLLLTAMLATQKRPLVESGELDKNCVIRVTHYNSNAVQNRRILILLNFEVLTPPLPDRIGAPKNYDEAVKTEDASGVAVKPENGATVPATRPAAAAAAGGGGSAKPAGGMGMRTGSSVGAGLPIYPIEGLSPYQNRWTIKARVTSKSDIKHWSNQRGEGKLFSVNLLDESGEIKATGFNEQVDRFYPLLQENKVYLISKARVNIAKKQFSNLSNEYEIALENQTEIEECTDASDVPEVKFEFVPIDQLESVEPNQTCDAIGILDSYGDVSEIISKASQRPVSKRELTLVDQSTRSVRVTLWGKSAESFPTHAGVDEKPVLAFKGVRVGDFGGRSLSALSSSSMMVNPDIPEAHGLRGWYDNDGARAEFKPFTSGSGAGGLGQLGGGGAGAGAGGNANERRTIAQVKDETAELGDKPLYFNVRATILFVKQDNLWYTACAGDGCNKKVTQQVDGLWRCEKCDRSYEAPEYRYILSLNVADATGQAWLSGFNEEGTAILGMSARELHGVREENEAAYMGVLQRALNRMYQFNCRAKMDHYNVSASACAYG